MVCHHRVLYAINYPMLMRRRTKPSCSCRFLEMVEQIETQNRARNSETIAVRGDYRTTEPRWLAEMIVVLWTTVPPPVWPIKEHQGIGGTIDERLGEYSGCVSTSAAKWRTKWKLGESVFSYSSMYTLVQRVFSLN